MFQGSSLGEYGFCSSESKDSRSTAIRKQILVSCRRLATATEMSWIPVHIKMVSVIQYLNRVEEGQKDKDYFFP
jgi:hypothetical protein